MSEDSRRIGAEGGRFHPVQRRILEVLCVIALFTIVPAIGWVAHVMHQRQVSLDQDLAWALDNRDPWKARDLVREGASPRVIGRLSQTTCTRVAIDLGDEGFLREVLDRGASAGHSSQSGVTPLMRAASAARARCVRLLLERGAEVNAADRKGKTALMYATAAAGAEDLLRLLIDQGADLNQQDAAGLTPLMWAVTWNQPTYVEILREAGADLSRRDSTSRTALQDARVRERQARRRAERNPRQRGVLARAQRIVRALSVP